jgi:hypothetical protein
MKRFLFVMASMTLVLFIYRNALAQCCDGVTQLTQCTGPHTSCTTKCSGPSADLGTDTVSTGCIDLSPDVCVAIGAKAAPPAGQPRVFESCVCMAGQCSAVAICQPGSCHPGIEGFGVCSCGGVLGNCVGSASGGGVCVAAQLTASVDTCAGLVVGACEASGITSTTCQDDSNCP